MTLTTDRDDTSAARFRELAAAVARLDAVVVEAVARLDALDQRLAASQAGQARAAERLEHLATELDRGPQLASLGDQVAALRGGQEDAAHRVEQMAAHVTRLERLDAALGHLRDELGTRVVAAENALQTELAALRQERAREAAGTARELHELREALADTAALADRVTAAERRQSEAEGAGERAAARIDALAATRVELLDMVRRAEQGLVARMDEIARNIDTTATEVGRWRGRIDEQSEAVRAARGVVETVREEAARMSQAHHATAEAERLFEARVLAELTELRREAETTWAAFTQERRRDWSALAHANEQRDGALAALGESLAEAGVRLDDLERATATAMGRQADALVQLRIDAVGALATWKDAAARAVEQLEAALPRDDRSATAAERREVLRKSLRMRRDEPHEQSD